MFIKCKDHLILPEQGQDLHTEKGYSAAQNEIYCIRKDFALFKQYYLLLTGCLTLDTQRVKGIKFLCSCSHRHLRPNKFNTFK